MSGRMPLTQLRLQRRSANVPCDPLCGTQQVLSLPYEWQIAPHMKVCGSSQGTRRLAVDMNWFG